MITDDAAQRALTGKGAEETVAGVNRNVTTGVDTSGKIGNNFDKQALQATMEVTQAFAAAAAKQVGDYASNKLNEATALAKQASEEPDPVKSAELQRQSDELKANWKEDGPARVALHTAVGALTGGSNGALGAGAAALSTDSISRQLQTLDIPDTLRSALTLAAGAAIGAAVGGEVGANSAVNEVANNYLKHKREGMKKSEQEQFDAAVAACSSSNPDACARRDSLIKLSTERDTLIGNVCSSGPSKDCSSLVSAAYGEGYKVIFGSDKKAYVYLQGSPELRAVPDPRDGTYHYAQAASLRDGLELAGTDLVVGKALGGIAAGGKYVYDGLVNGVRGLLDSSAQAVGRLIEAGPVPIRNAELMGSNGTGIARQNPLTNAWESVVPVLSKDGVNSAVSFGSDEIRFSQNSVSFGKVDRATNQAYTYDDLVKSMQTNGWKGDAVDVVRMPDGHLTSIDNTRISAAREAGIDVQAKVRSFDSPLTKDEIGRFTKGNQVPSTWGDAITIRINSQSGAFSVKYPYGADPLPRVKGRPKQ
ncbi:putative uncharacterized domain protein [Janthinobacterium agaricidamnosum NBRC 102515 = DSM 9628]|uniref:Uncharacterized domain protein n=1 Tax=Janthinobacterium agaricidamnosum NBRC 102515 = DSM 9628 TaxID=1349767 RepID=W0V5Y7_9BURK|nr:hypothetical protein [Janthinobacterium agaricidamnosum]CDG82990.1 putative uncharacterized domain protein [Janthinobacterium agaricidamnosum NBRC 102515 = DSM 9628]